MCRNAACKTTGMRYAFCRRPRQNGTCQCSNAHQIWACLTTIPTLKTSQIYASLVLLLKARLPCSRCACSFPPSKVNVLTQRRLVQHVHAAVPEQLCNWCTLTMSVTFASIQMGCKSKVCASATLCAHVCRILQRRPYQCAWHCRQMAASSPMHLSPSLHCLPPQGRPLMIFSAGCSSTAELNRAMHVQRRQASLRRGRQAAPGQAWGRGTWRSVQHLSLASTLAAAAVHGLANLACWAVPGCRAVHRTMEPCGSTVPPACQQLVLAKVHNQKSLRPRQRNQKAFLPVPGRAAFHPVLAPARSPH